MIVRKKNMNKIAHLVLWLLILGLLIFTGIRTVHFLGLTFPPDQGYMAYVGLAAFDVGVLLWFLFGKYGARGWQRAIAYLMIFICLLGVCLCTYADTMVVSAANGIVKLPPGTADMALRGIIVIILTNVVAGIGAHIADPDHLRQWAIEAAKDKIEDQTLKHIAQQAVLIAPDIAERQAQVWTTQTYQNLMLPTPQQKKKAVDDEPTEK